MHEWHHYKDFVYQRAEDRLILHAWERASYYIPTDYTRGLHTYGCRL